MFTLDPGEVILAVKEHIKLMISIYRNGEKKQIKSDFSMEKYLSFPSHLHSALAKFRLSCHSLAIETGHLHKTLITTREKTMPSVQGYGR